MRNAMSGFFDNTTPTGRCLIGIALSWPFFLWQWTGYAWVTYFDAGWPGLQPGVVRALTHLTEAGLLINGLLALWLWPRRRNPGPCFAAQLVCGVVIASLLGLYQVALGLYTTGMSMSTVGLLGIGLLLFDRRVVLIGFALTVGLLLCSDALVLAGHLPYAPALTPALGRDGELAWWWLYWRNFLFYASFVCWVGVIFWLLRRMDAQGAKLEALPRTDELTGLPNRRHFMERLEVATQRRHRYGRAFSVVLCDIDQLRKVNGDLGYRAGDEVLRHVALLLEDSLRVPADLAARLAGGEFALLLPETSRVQAELVCARIRKRLQAHEFCSGGQRFHITMSMGIVECLHSLGEEAFRQAALNLDAAKAAGRNQVVSTADGSGSGMEVPA